MRQAENYSKKNILTLNKLSMEECLEEVIVIWILLKYINSTCLHSLFGTCLVESSLGFLEMDHFKPFQIIRLEKRT